MISAVLCYASPLFVQRAHPPAEPKGAHGPIGGRGFARQARKQMWLRRSLPSPCLTFLLPRGLCLQIDSMLRKFWWDNNGERKETWVSWESMTMPKYMGVLVSETPNWSTWSYLLNTRGGFCKITLLKCQNLKAAHYPDGVLLQLDLGSHPRQVWRAMCWK